MKSGQLLTTLVLAVWFSLGLYGQDMSGNLELHIDSIIDNLPSNSGDNYVEPTSAQRAYWSGLVSSILQGDYSMTDSMNYRLIEFLDQGSSETYYILEEKSPRPYYWGTYIFNPAPCRTKVVIQSPHPKYDFNTGKEGVFVFQRLGARAFCLSGTHRCNHSQASSCSGTTSSCGTSASFRISDMPHTTSGMFHETTSTMVSELQDAVFVQLHGFSKQATDPYVILSNGTRETPTMDYIPLLTTGLLQADPTLSFKVAHIDTTWTRLIAFTNVQGRMINNSADYCNTSATTTSGNFIHIEQEKTKLRDDSTGWNKVYSALASTFSCDSAVVLEVLEQTQQPFTVYPSINAGRFTVGGMGIEAVVVYNQMGNLICNSPGGSLDVEMDITRQ
ncbi:MAG: hypothetical protein JKX73_04010, partial [Flavobacteriales bacterium]|nr:hypothetical protein [Flavobacteriales bacterium]